MTFSVKTLDGRTSREMTGAQLRSIVVPRVLEIFRMVKANIVASVPRDQILSEVVITGGGARLRGIDATAADFFGLPVRIGVPTTIAGLNDAIKQPEYATAVGLVLFGPRGEGAPHMATRTAPNPLARMWTWLGGL